MIILLNKQDYQISNKGGEDLKKAVIMFIIIFSVLLSSCRIYDDPFITETDNATTDENRGDNETETETDIPEKTVFRSRTDDFPEDDFYGLSASEAVKKYGILSKSNYTSREMVYDGKYYYGVYLTTGEKTVYSTLVKIEYPNGKELNPVCTDPLCTHKPGSDCPMQNMNGAYFACYGDKIYIVSRDCNLYMYDKRTNKKTMLLKNCYAAVFFKYDDKFYLNYSETDKDFETTRVIVNISEEGKITELSRFDNYYSMELPVYKERYVIDYQQELFDENGRINVLMRDLQSDKITKVTEIECPGAAFIEPVETFTLYGNKLLFQCNYYTVYPPRSDYDRKYAVYLIDLETKEKRLICTPDYNTYKNGNPHCLFSSKCVVWDEPRIKKSDPMIYHVLFPYEDKELTYNLSEMVKNATGEDIGLDEYVATNSNSAFITFKVTYAESGPTVSTHFELDLENGNVYKYDVPQ